MSAPAPYVVSRAFDAAAPVYDREFEQHRSTRRIRRIMIDVFLRHFPKGSSLLELNCGTGTDAITLACHGMKIHATDDSSAMVSMAQEKVGLAGLGDRIVVERLSFHELHRMSGRTFDGIYSNFGGLNCVRDLSPIALDASTLIKPGGHLVVSVMSDFCLWESAAFLARLRWKDAFRRLQKDGVSVLVHGQSVRTYYHSPAHVASAFERYFALVESGGLNIFTPAPASAGAYRILGRSVSLLETLDDVACRTFPFRRIGDHFYVVMTRNDDRSEA